MFKNMNQDSIVISLLGFQASDEKSNQESYEALSWKYLLHTVFQ